MPRPLLILLACFTVIILSVFLIFNIRPKSSPAQISINTPISTSTFTTSSSIQGTSTEPSIGTSSASSTLSDPPPSVLPPKIKPTPKPVPAPTPAITINGTEIMAWIYPGAPTCSASAEYSDGRKIDILKAEYFTIDGSGNMNFLTVQNSGCNAYSAANVVSLKKYSTQQYATFSSSYSVTMDTFLTNALSGNSDINTLVSFAVSNKITGIELDFEDFGGWTAPMYANYKQFIIKLGNALHSNNKKLMVDGPATSNAVEQNWYVWRYADFNSLPVDKLVVMTYDYQYDQGPGMPVSPISWIKDTIKWTLSEFSDKNKISFGIPSYGYKGIVGTQKFSLLTYNQLKAEPGFSTAMRDSSSAEMTWQNGGNVFFYQDGQSMLKKLQAIQALGIKSVSVWHLGGNLWFSKN
jgi:spore germination protein YaaH